MNTNSEKELIDVSHAWDRAMVENDPEAIGAYMADDWVIVGSNGNITDKTTFLGLVKSGAMSHDVMESHDLNVRVYGETAVVIARGVSGGKYQGTAFRACRFRIHKKADTLTASINSCAKASHSL